MNLNSLYLLPPDNLDGRIENFVETYTDDTANQISRFNEQVASQIEQALPNILNLTNKIGATLDNATLLTSNLNNAAVNAQPLLCELLPERSRSTAIGFMNMVSCFVGGGGVLLAGALKSSFGLANAFASLAAIQGFVMLMLLVTFLTVLPKDLARVQKADSL